MADLDIVVKLAKKIEAAQILQDTYDAYYQGNQDLAFLTPEAKRQLGDRLTALSVNYCKLAVDSIAERLHISGFTVNGQPAPQLWETWEQNLGPDLSSQAHIESMVLGASFCLVWVDSFGKPVISAESPREVAAVTRQ